MGPLLFAGAASIFDVLSEGNAPYSAPQLKEPEVPHVEAQ
jgi:hypothetical protein